jgi:hypothetical protein
MNTSPTAISNSPLEPESNLTLYMLQTDAVNSATDVFFGPQMVCIAPNFQEACDYFFASYNEVDAWEEIQKDLGNPSDYNALSAEEKQKAHREWYEDAATMGHEIHSFPLIYLEGIKHLLTPLQQENARLQRELEIESLRHAISDPQSNFSPLPNEILDMHIKRRL